MERELLETVVERLSRMWPISLLALLSWLFQVDACWFTEASHCNITESGYKFDSFCWGRCGWYVIKMWESVDARRIFDGLVEPDRATWTAVISSYVLPDVPEKALEVSEEMQGWGHVQDQVAFLTDAWAGLGRLDDNWPLFLDMANRIARLIIEMDSVGLFRDMTKAGFLKLHE